VETVLYIVIAVLGIAAAWWILKVALGMLLPLEKTAHAYLVQLLQTIELSRVVPPSCVDECVSESVQFARTSAKFHGNKEQIRAETVKQLELHADMLRLWVRSAEPFDAVYKARFKVMFERHHVPRLGH